MGVLSLCLFVSVTAVIYANPVEETHLVTMRKAEMMEIISCISESKNPVLCDKFAECEKLMPSQVIAASDLCKKKCTAGGIKKCSLHEPLFETHEVPSKIFDCIKENSLVMHVEDKKKMVDFEKCVRKLHNMSCKFPKHA